MVKEKMPKNKWLGTRIDGQMEKEVSDYINATDMVRGDLVRKGVREYMQNHPVKRELPDQTRVTKPGE